MKKLLLVFCALLFTSTFIAQKKTITGTVSDKDGGLPGVSVIIKGTTNGADTDFDGKYSIETQVGDILVFSYLGYITVEKTVGTNPVINVVLKEGGAMLDEVVISGYAAGVKLSSTSSSVVIRGVSSIKSSKSKIRLPQSGQLTAGEINDLQKWREWKQLYHRDDFKKIKREWELVLGK